MKRVVFRIEEVDDGQRLDRWLSDRLQIPRNQIQRWIRDGYVVVDGQPAKASHVMESGETVAAVPQVVDAADTIEPEPGEVDIVFEDEAIIVVDKPAGLVVHPGAGHRSGTLVHRLLARYPEIGTVGGPGRPGIVHRLDKDTSGLLVVARQAVAYDRLSRAFAERQIDKRYLAVVYGTPRRQEGRIDRPIGRHPTRRKEMTVLDHGRPALTRYRRVASAAGVSLLEIDLATGRTHQIRVHLKSEGHPLVGDPTYGEARWKAWPRRSQAPLREFPRPALHAWRLGFTHPITTEALQFEAPVPADLRTLWQSATGESFPDLD